MKIIFLGHIFSFITVIVHYVTGDKCTYCKKHGHNNRNCPGRCHIQCAKYCIFSSITVNTSSDLIFFEQVDPLILINALITGRLHILSKLRSLIFLLELNKLVRSKAQTIKTTRFGKGERHRTLGVT